MSINGASVVHDAWAEAWRCHAQADLLRREGGPLEVAAEEAGRALCAHLAHDDAAAADARSRGRTAVQWR
ncbi:hypothetical protein [Streptomyces sp. NPDC056723]|uniref:hypothetical protein n=1 Tax=Streptomyces sp. NPDC056723 TaxID=3345925 RepID=UPI0036811266